MATAAALRLGTGSAIAACSMLTRLSPRLPLRNFPLWQLDTHFRRLLRAFAPRRAPPINHRPEAF
jgi:hypothetical protein